MSATCVQPVTSSAGGTGMSVVSSSKMKREGNAVT